MQRHALWLQAHPSSMHPCRHEMHQDCDACEMPICTADALTGIALIGQGYAKVLYVSLRLLQLINV